MFIGYSQRITRVYMVSATNTIFISVFLRKVFFFRHFIIIYIHIIVSEALQLDEILYIPFRNYILDETNILL